MKPLMAKLIAGLRWRISVAVVGYVLSATLSQAFPLGVGLVVAEALDASGPERNHILAICAITLAFVVMRGTCYGTTISFASGVGRLIVARLRTAAVRTSLEPVTDGDSPGTEDDLTLQTYDIIVIEDFLEDAAERLLNVLFSCMTAIVALFLLGPGIGTAALLPLLLVVVLVAFGRRRVVRSAEASRIANGELLDTVADHSEIAASADASSLRDWGEERFGERNVLASSSFKQSQQAGTLYGLAVRATGIAATLLVLAVASTAGSSDAARAGLIVSAVLLVRRFYEPVQGLVQYDATWIRTFSSLRRLAARIVPTMGADSQLVETTAEHGCRGAVELLTLESVRFAYGSREIIASASLSVRRGEVVAISGPSGSGKSTLARTIAGILRESDGIVAIDGVRASRATRRYMVQVASPATPWFPGTVSRNLEIEGRLSSSEMVFALEASGLNARLRELGVTAECDVSELTDSQRRELAPHLAIARVAVSSKPILILDEVAAGIAFEEESRAMVAIRSRLATRICIIISHRASSVGYASRRFLLRDGVLREHKRTRIPDSDDRPSLTGPKTHQAYNVEE